MDETNDTAGRVRAAAQALWQIRLEQPFWRHTGGLVVESIPSGSLAETRRDAGRVAAIAASLHRLREAELAGARSFRSPR